jgi:aldose 1-epimerase
MLTAAAEQLVAGDLEAGFAGITCTSLRHRGEELLGPLGIPFLHPWANRLSREHYEFAGRLAHVPAGAPRDEHGLPIHGLEQGEWAIAGRRDRLRGTLDHDSPDGFPFPHRVELEARLTGDELRITTVIVATADIAVPISFGFHPYFRLPGVVRRAWRVTMPQLCHEQLDLDNIPTGRAQAEPAAGFELGSLTFDDAYVDVEPGAAFLLAGGGRQIEVRFDSGYPVAQVFAPAHADVVCFEPMTAPVNALVTGERLQSIGPGERYEATFTIAVSEL